MTQVQVVSPPLPYQDNGSQSLIPRSRLEQFGRVLSWLSRYYVSDWPRFLYVMIVWMMRRSVEREIPLPKGFTQKLRIRCADSDFLCMLEVFHAQAYSLSANLRERTNLDSPPWNDLLILDIGANVGCSAIWFSKHFPGATIIAVEPDIDSFRMLEANSRPIPDIVCINAALGTTNGSQSYRFETGGKLESWAKRFSEDQTQFPNLKEAALDSSVTECRVTTVSVEALLALFSKQRLLIKMDIEGIESQIFKNCSWLVDVDIILVEIHDWLNPDDPSATVVLDKVLPRKPLISTSENVFAIYFLKDRVVGVDAVPGS